MKASALLLTASLPAPPLPNTPHALVSSTLEKEVAAESERLLTVLQAELLLERILDCRGPLVLWGGSREAPFLENSNVTTKSNKKSPSITSKRIN